MNEKLDKSVAYVKGVGPKRAEMFAKVGVYNVYDLLQYCPRSYIDLTAPLRIKDIDTDEPVAVRGRIVKKLPPAHIRKGMTICRAVFTDDTDDLTVVLYNQEYQFTNLKEGESYVLYGRITGNLVRREISSPQIYPANTPDLLLPIYPLTEGLTQNIVRKAVKNALDQVDGSIEDPLPSQIRDMGRLCSLSYAWDNIHFPKTDFGAKDALRRLAFDELFIHSLAVAYRRENNCYKSNYVMSPVDTSEFLNALPFCFTNAQKRAFSDCIIEMCGQRRMNRLIQGDVGSGKTAVAVGAAWFAVRNGYQACVMAPTEILAKQHYDTFSSILSPLGIKTALLTGSLTPKNKNAMQKAIADGEYDIVVGTHALFSENTVFKALALVITDEQHRFGVEQRAALAAKGQSPHSIVMSATPIPRTLALIFYGDLDISILDELPAGRKPIKTFAVREKLRQRAFGYVKAMLDQGRQGYVVCPAIEDGSELVNVQSYSQRLTENEFAGYKVGVLHGKLSAAEKETVMNGFKNGDIQLLVATTVVEVGVDVPNAAFMIIENADRFGLSQLHQLRGRVGRGGYDSVCILITDNTSEDCIKRMKTICATNDGFEIAEEDLRQRGPGDFFGTQQHGLPPFRIADLSRDVGLVELAQRLSSKIIKEDPTLKNSGELGRLAERLLQKGAQTG